MERGREGGRQEERESKKRNRERGMRGWHSGGKIERRREDGEKGGTSSSRTGRCCLWVYNDLCVLLHLCWMPLHTFLCVCHLRLHMYSVEWVRADVRPSPVYESVCFVTSATSVWSTGCDCCSCCQRGWACHMAHSLTSGRRDRGQQWAWSLTQTLTHTHTWKSLSCSFLKRACGSSSSRLICWTTDLCLFWFNKGSAQSWEITCVMCGFPARGNDSLLLLLPAWPDHTLTSDLRPAHTHLHNDLWSIRL